MVTVTDPASPVFVPAPPLSAGALFLVGEETGSMLTFGAVVSIVKVTGELLPTLPASSLSAAWAVYVPSPRVGGVSAQLPPPADTFADVTTGPSTDAPSWIATNTVSPSPLEVPAAPSSVRPAALAGEATGFMVTLGAAVSMTKVTALLSPVLPALSFCVAWAV